MPRKKNTTTPTFGRSFSIAKKDIEFWDKVKNRSLFLRVLYTEAKKDKAFWRHVNTTFKTLSTHRQ